MPSRNQVASFVQLSNEGACELTISAVYACMVRCSIEAGNPFEAVPAEELDPCNHDDLLTWLAGVPSMAKYQEPTPPQEGASKQAIFIYESKKSAYAKTREIYAPPYKVVADLCASIEAKLGLPSRDKTTEMTPSPQSE